MTCRPAKRCMWAIRFRGVGANETRGRNGKTRRRIKAESRETLLLWSVPSRRYGDGVRIRLLSSPNDISRCQSNEFSILLCLRTGPKRLARILRITMEYLTSSHGLLSRTVSHMAMPIGGLESLEVGIDAFVGRDAMSQIQNGGEPALLLTVPGGNVHQIIRPGDDGTESDGDNLDKG